MWIWVTMLMGVLKKVLSRANRPQPAVYENIVQGTLYRNLWQIWVALPRELWRTLKP